MSNELSNVFSKFVSLSHGVRQGGVFSPYFWSLVVDKMLLQLNNSKFGCTFKGFPIAALMYADDVILITASVTGLQNLINLCHDYLLEIDLLINPAKTYWIRIGSRCHSICTNLVINNKFIETGNELTFLGSIICSNVKFMVSLSKNKVKFFGNANKILSKIGTSNLPVIVKLINAYCSSALLYNLEIFDLSKNLINSLTFFVNRLFMKVFKSSQIDVIEYCLYCFGILPSDLLLPIRKVKYLLNLLKKEDMLNIMFSDIIKNEHSNIVNSWRAIYNSDYPSKSNAWEILSEKIRY